MDIAALSSGGKAGWQRARRRGIAVRSKCSIPSTPREGRDRPNNRELFASSRVALGLASPDCFQTPPRDRLTDQRQSRQLGDE